MKHHAPEVYAEVEALLAEEQWSPEQIASQLPERLGVRLSHMTIYRHVRRDQQAGGLFRHLRQAASAAASARMVLKSGENWPTNR